MIPPLNWKFALTGLIVDNLEPIFIMIGCALFFYALNMIATGSACT